MNPDPRPAPHDSEDDPRVLDVRDELRRAYVSGYRQHYYADLDHSRDLLARLDAPARDDTAGLRRWLDGEIGEADRITESRAKGHLHLSAAISQNRASALREVRERLGATTHTPEEGP